MSACCHDFACATEAQFGAARAAADLARYRKRGPDATTRLLVQSLRDTTPTTGSIIDVGAGIGALTFELLKATDATALVVEASQAFLRAAREETSRRGLERRVEFVEGDLVAIASGLAPADLVAMDRVICCYPDAAPLLEAGLVHARHAFGFSYPRDRWYVRAVTGLLNALRRRRGNPFRTYLHGAAEMRAVLTRHGFTLATQRGTVAWAVEVWRRVG